MCRSRRELSNEYLLAKIGVDTAENEPFEVWRENSIQHSIVSLMRGSGTRVGRVCKGDSAISRIDANGLICSRLISMKGAGT